MHEEQCCGHAGRTRRDLLTLPLQVGALTVIGAAAGRAATVAKYEADEGTPGSPEEAIAALMAGNQRYVASRLNVCSSDLPKVRQETESKQTPFAAILSCADLRVPVELVSDQGVGQVFVARVAGNIATPEIIASLEVRSGRFGDARDHGVGAWELRGGGGDNSTQASAGADFEFVRVYPPGCGPGGRGVGAGDKDECSVAGLSFWRGHRRFWQMRWGRGSWRLCRRIMMWVRGR